MKRKQQKTTYIASDLESEAYLWCVRNDVRVSPGGTKTKGEWTIDVSTDGKTWKRSPWTVQEDSLWQKYYEICLWYYEKYKN